MFKPRKRKKEEMDQLLDFISALKSSILIKLRLEDEMKEQSKLIHWLKYRPLFTYLLLIITPIWTMSYLKKRKIERIEKQRDLEVKVKARNKYHSNELEIEEALKQHKAEMDLRFDSYLNRLNEILERPEIFEEDRELPFKDAELLVQKYNQDPPKDNQEKLELYLSIESTLVQFM